MTHEFDLARSLAAAAGDRRAAWDFLRLFAEHWTAAPLSDGDGWPEADLAAAEDRLGLRLPPALREAYALLGRRRDLTAHHDTLRSPAALYVDESGEALVLRDENQGALRWGILLADLTRDDPPVRFRTDLADKSAEAWEPWLDRTSLAFVEMVLSESVQSPEELVDYLDAPGDEVVAQIEQEGIRLALPVCPPTDPDQATRWFLYGDVLLRDDAGAWLLVRGRTPEALDRVREDVDGDWLNG